MRGTPPAEFGIVGLDGGRFDKAAPDEWHGPCPFCGGRDRFVIFTDKDYPHWNWFCRQCHPDNAWIDEINPNIREPLSPERAAEIARKAEESLKREIERAERALKELKEAQAWERYHKQLDDEARERWESWGIPHFWQLYWKLGYDPDHVVWTGDTEWHTPTMTIPIFEVQTWDCLNVRHRLLNPPSKGDKYRPEKAGLPPSVWVADVDCPMNVAKSVMVVEGEKKGAVTFITADNPTMQVVGVPGKNGLKLLPEMLEDAEPIYICLDPDATHQAVDLAWTLGDDRCRVIELPDKIDDLILKYDLDKYWMRNVIRQAVKVG